MIASKTLKEDPLIKKITTIKEAIEFLEHCRDIHQDFADNPNICNEQVGYVSHHQSCIERYNETINLMKKRSEEK